MLFMTITQKELPCQMYNHTFLHKPVRDWFKSLPAGWPELLTERTNDPNKIVANMEQAMNTIHVLEQPEGYEFWAAAKMAIVRSMGLLPYINIY